MAYNEELAQRMRSALKPLSKNIEEKRMFGGIAFMYKNKMACGVMKDDMMVRVVAEKYEDRLKHPDAREMDFTGKTIKNFLYVSPSAFETEEKLMDWINLSIEHAEEQAK